MARALQLAERGRYTAHPNPVVGCVLAAGDTIVGEGWHRRTGGAHAEVDALRAAGERARGATAYVTLEPCAHHGETPPCTTALIAAGVARVVAAITDPNPDVAGGGLQRLADAGIDVQSGLMESVAEKLNRGFFSRVTTGRPFVRLKLAASLDGAIAMTSGESRWISGEAARADVQRLRARSGAVLTGIGTVLADDPSLTVRAPEIDTGGLQPLRVVLDSRRRMPSGAAMLSLPGTTLVCCLAGDDAGLREAGADVSVFPESDGRVDTDAVLRELADRGVNELLVESGPVLAGHLLENDRVDELVIYQAPHMMGSRTMNMLDTPSWSSLADRASLDITDVRRVGDDTRITAAPRRQD